MNAPIAGHTARQLVSNSRRLWSLWDIMLKQAAWEFARAAGQLTILEFSCAYCRVANPQVLIEPTGTLEENALNILGNLKRVCILADVDEILPEIDRFGAKLTGQARIEDILGSAHHLKYRLFDELQNEWYLQVDRTDVRFYGQKELFGAAVKAKFPKAADDIENAGNCLALRQPIASVFHLMRAMEIAVRKLGKRLKMTITPQSTWRQMTGGMDGKIKNMSDATEPQKRKKNNWEEARTNLHHVGSVWRNNTMHPATSYTQSQANDVFNAVRVFMSGLCAL